MKKFFRALRNNYLPALIFLISGVCFASLASGQTVSEITNILNTKVQSVTTAAVSANNTNLFSLDLSTSGYRSITIQITGTWTATVTFQGSNDNFTTADAIPVVQTTSLNPSFQTSTTANGTFQIPTYGYRYIRVRTTAYTSGTINSTAYATMNNVVLPTLNMSATLSGSLPAGTNNIGDVDVLTIAAGDNNIGNVDVVTLPALPTGTNNIGDVDVLTVPADPFGVNADAASATGSISAKLRFIAATGIPVTSLPSVTIGTFPDNEPFNVAQINGVTPLMGNGTTGTGSQRVTISSDNTAFSVNPLSATAPIMSMNSASANSGLNSAMAATFDDAAITSITENNFGFLRISANRNLYNTIRDAAGNERGANVNASNELLVALSSVPSHAVTNAGTFAVQVDGNALTALQLIDDPVFVDNAAFTDNSSKVNASGFYFDETAGTALTENDIAAARIDSKRAQVMVIEDETTRGRRLTVTAANAMKVDGSGVTQPVSISGNQAVNIAQINGVTPLMGNGVTGTGSHRVTLASDGTAISTTGYMSVKVDQTTLGTTNGVTQVPSATVGGLDTYHRVSDASTNAVNVKNSAGKLYGYYIFNANAAARKVAFHNTSGTPTAGSSIFFSIVIPASSGANVEFANGITFGTGIGITMVTGTADADATAVAAGDLIVNLFFK